MDNSTLNNQQPADPSSTKEASSESTFQPGLLEIVEAFTGMRHEWRTQSKQGRELGQSIKESTELMASIEATLDQKLSAVSSESDSKNLISLIIDMDIGLTRAVEAIDGIRETRKFETASMIQSSFQQSGIMARWFARKFYRQLIDGVESQLDARPDSTLEGLKLLLNRLRRMMSENDLTRVETIGTAFDGVTMKAISTVDSEQFNAGIVAEEINPAYIYRGDIVRLAEVRVAK